MFSMPLHEMSPNIQESGTTARKRDLDEFAEDYVKSEAASPSKAPSLASIRPSNESLLPPVVPNGIQSSPQGSPALSEAGSSTAARNSPSPQTPTKPAVDQMPSDANQPSAATSNSQTPGAGQKPKRLTPAEKEAREKEAAEKKKMREEKAQSRAAEKAKQDEEKAMRIKERDEKRKKKEEEDRLKAQQRDEKKRKKEEEQHRVQEEQERKKRSQQRINKFFQAPATPKKGSNHIPIKNESPMKGGALLASEQLKETEYSRRFKPFYVRDDTTVAVPATRLDDETREAKSSILDEYITGQRKHELASDKLDAVELLALPCKPPRRGRLHHPVRHIMETVYAQTQKSSNLDSQEAHKILAEAKAKLEKVPMKVIAFSRDVRPPYCGTLTFKTFALGTGNMRQLARRSTSKRLPLDYDYDSEAEWQEEEGEDVDMDDDEEEVEDEDDMDGFLDDSEDLGPARRIFANAIEPDSTGICFEDSNRRGPDRTAYGCAMEFMHEGLEQHWGINPWSDAYWEPDVKTRATRATTKATQAGTEKVAKMAPPPAPTNAFAALKGEPGPGTGAGKLVKAELMNDLKETILANKALSKLGMIEVIFNQFRVANVSRAEVKNTIEHVAEKKGSGRLKEWELREGHDIHV